ncbi:MAG: tRNA uridine-5-carboxymethylaminomethyl(34) synthesis enzyme MnmG [Firmicutes bacterium]|nr:tRNA uridine-5-carboxymethylaminomethyl(34) synthesis enzyme MnmG [Bacillota bacterium]
MAERFDLLVVGGGHAGCEAALAGAKMGARTGLILLDLADLAWMPCNPSIGGPAKGHLVKEIDALGGVMGRAADATYLQIRRLNTSKGPAVPALRAQIDKYAYQHWMRRTLERQENLSLAQGEVVAVLVEGDRVRGVRLRGGEEVYARTVVLTTGTFLGAVIHLGLEHYPAGPQNRAPANELAASLRSLGFTLRRLKTGTPARVRGRSLCWAEMERQKGEELSRGFSFWRELPRRPQHDSWLTYTQPATHELIRAHLHETALYGGKIVGVGPRYCPSIESKIVRFPERERHQVFVEPESEATDEWYLAGLSTSLPPKVQIEILHTIPGLRQAEIVRPGYAIEYDAIEATVLHPTLESRAVTGLFFAGQINGTSGYEEAAAQGLVAGINAVLSLRGEKPLILRRDQAYIGVLIDEIVTKESDEPFRMLTARVEHRLLLRGETADLRLAEIGYGLGLIPAEDYERFLRRRERLAAAEELLATRRNPGSELTAWANRHRTTPPSHVVSLRELLRRPEIDLAALAELEPALAALPAEEAEEITLSVKYEGYIARARAEAERLRAMEDQPLSPDLDYAVIPNLSQEAVEKLSKIRPMTLGQAGRISGISPADLLALLVHLRR